MITALATVVRVNNTPDGDQIELSCEQQTSCSHCSSRQSCGTGIVSKAVANKSHRWILTTTPNAASVSVGQKITVGQKATVGQKITVGQIVEIGLPEKSLLQFASLVYLLPLTMLIFGALIGQFIVSPVTGWGEGATILLSMLCMIIGIWLARQASVKLQSKSEQSVTLIRVINQNLE